jgi:serine/threonine protein kinase
MIGKTVGNYRIISKLGAGGMGEVFLAEDTRLQRKAAIKFLSADLASDPALRQRFLKEARAASALNHPHVCIVYDVGETEDAVPFIAMELIDGDSLDRVLPDRPMSITRIIEIGAQVADALDAAHASRIVHRDIKLANICLNERGQVKVLDFGLAKQMASDSPGDLGVTSEMQQTHDGQVLGTPTYMSPEQALGKAVDHRTDIFSVGVVLYRMITLELPFIGSNFAEIVDKIVHAQPVAIARLNYNTPAELERITLKCLQKSPERRYQSARELLIDLQQLSRALETSSQRDTTTGIEGMPSVQAGKPCTNPTRLSAELDQAEPASPEEISQSDVLITYANLDDQPIQTGRQGWVSQLHQNLQVRVAQLSGKQVAVVKQSGAAESAEIEAAVLEHVPRAKTVVSILSPPFAQSNGCHRIVEKFWKSASDSGQFSVDEHSRLLNVIKAPVSEDDIPANLRPMYTDLVPYEFFERDPQSGRLREFDETFGDVAVQRFHERVYDVAYDISQVLKYLGESDGDGGERTANPKTVFLAATTSDLESQRDQLRRELVEFGHQVLPKQPLPLVANDLVAAVKSCLERADMAIHFVGEHFGLVPEATDLSVIALQNKVAAEFCGNAPLKRLVWIPKGLQIRDQRQAAFVRQLESEPQLMTGAELIADTLENLKLLLLTRWEKEQAALESPPVQAASNGAPRVYLICDQRDEEAVEPLEDFFYAQGIEVSLPGFEADESEVQQIHIQNLRDCDAAMIFYGAAGMHWVDFQIRDLQKAAGYRDACPIPVSAVYLAPPFNRRKERFKSLSVDVIQQTGEVFAPAMLEAFVESTRRAKENK